MAAKQQKYVSVRAATYEQVRAYCQTHNLSTSHVVQELCEAYLEKRPPGLAAPNEADTQRRQPQPQPQPQRSQQTREAVKTTRLFTDEELAQCPH